MRQTVGIAYGAPGGPESPIVWHLGEFGQLSWKEPAGEWQTDREGSFRMAPVVTAISDDERVAIALDGEGDVVYLPYHDGAWDFEAGWTSLGLRACVNRPSAVSTAAGTLDVFIIDSERQVRHINLDEGTWGEWETIGEQFFGEVAATASGSRIDVFAATGEVIKYKARTTAGWAADWEDLGHPSQGRWGQAPFTSPMALSFEGTQDDGELGYQMDVVVVVEGMGSFHKAHGPSGEWSDWVVISASHEGYEFANTQAMVQGGPDAPGHLFSRGTDDCIHYNSYNGTSWTFWTYLWCLPWFPGQATYRTEFLPLAAAISEDTRIGLVAQNVTGEILYLDLQLPVDFDGQFGDLPWENLGP